MQSTIEATITDRDWPELRLVVKVGTNVRVETARFDHAEKKFQEVINSAISQLVSSTKFKRGVTNGS